MPVAGSDLTAPSTDLIRRGAVYCATVYLIARLLLSLVGLATVDAPTVVHPPSGSPSLADQITLEPGVHNIFEATVRWDARWFVWIASAGYDATDGSAEFYPAFPLAGRATAWATPLGPTGASILIANLAFLVALIVLYLLSTLEFSEAVAKRTVVLLTVYPASFVLLSPLSESMFLLATVTTFYMARRGRWWAASVMGVIATATRAVGILLVPSLLLEAAAAEPRLRRRRIVAALIPGFGLATYLGYWWLREGDPTIPLRAPELWGRTVEFPLSMLGRAVALGVTGLTADGGWILSLELAMVAVLIVPLALWWRALRPSYVVYAAVTFVLLLMVSYAPRPLAGAPRYLCVVFPVFWLLAARLEGRRFIVAVVVSGTAWIVLAITFIQGATFVF